MGVGVHVCVGGEGVRAFIKLSLPYTYLLASFYVPLIICLLLNIDHIKGTKQMKGGSSLILGKAGFKLVL